jgi:hypothetical protein
MGPEDSTRDLRLLQALGAEALMVEGQVGKPVSAALDQVLGAYAVNQSTQGISPRDDTGSRASQPQ